MTAEFAPKLTMSWKIEGVTGARSLAMMRDATATMRVEPMFPRNRRKVDLTDCLATSDPCSSRGGAIDSEEVKVSVFSTLGRFRTIYQFMKYLHCICIGSLF